MRIYVTGTRGIPEIAGGVETHCQMLYPFITRMGHDVCVVARRPYITQEKSIWKQVEIFNSYAPKNKSFEAIIHTFLAIMKARKYCPDLIHVHAIGPGLLVPLAKLLGYKVVFTHHGPDYNRQKWGIMAKTALRIGEYLGCRYADKVIAISPEIQRAADKISRGRASLIVNGVEMPPSESETDCLTQWNIKPGRYILAVARLVPEKGLHDLIEAYGDIKNFHLVIAGDTDHATAYSKDLKAKIAADKRIVLTGFIRGIPLQQLYAHASLFVLPSYHEGLPIVLLESMSYGLSILASDIQPNQEVGLARKRYFICGDIGDLKKKMVNLLDEGISRNEKKELITTVKQRYDWQRIARQTVNLYKKTVQTPDKI